MSLAARSDAPPKRAIDEAIRAIPIEWFKASPATYWADLLSSAAIGWATLAGGVMTRGWTRATLLTRVRIRFDPASPVRSARTALALATSALVPAPSSRRYAEGRLD